MEFAEVVRALESAGTAQNRKVYARHGIGPNMYGVSFANLRTLAKKLKHDQRLAEQLWKTGNHDCRTLACLIADPQKIKKSTLDAWSRSAGNRCAGGELAKLAAASPHALDLSARWCASSDVVQQQIGWATIAALAVEPDENGDLEDLFQACLDVIAANIHDSANFTRYAMNGALIAIGGYSQKSKSRALAIARRIGPVEVDHGETGCQTPDAAAYIAKIWSRKNR